MEVGVPTMGPEERESIRAIAALHLPARLMVWGRMRSADLAAAALCDAQMVNLSIPVSDLHIQHKLRRDRARVLEQITHLVPQALDLGFEVCVGAKAPRVPTPIFSCWPPRPHRRPARIVSRVADTLGLLDPFSAFNCIAKLRQAVDLDIEMHAHDDLGMATANTVAIVLAGATHISTTVNGTGERAGNAPLEEVVMALRLIHACETGIDTHRFPRHFASREHGLRQTGVGEQEHRR